MELHEIIQKFDIDMIERLNEEKKKQRSDDDGIFFDVIMRLGQSLNYITLKRMVGEVTEHEKLDLFTAIVLSVMIAYLTLSEDEKKEIATTQVEELNKAMEDTLRQMIEESELNDGGFHVEADMVQ